MAQAQTSQILINNIYQVNSGDGGAQNIQVNVPFQNCIILVGITANNNSSAVPIPTFNGNSMKQLAIISDQDSPNDTCAMFVFTNPAVGVYTLSTPASAGGNGYGVCALVISGASTVSTNYVVASSTAGAIASGVNVISTNITPTQPNSLLIDIIVDNSGPPSPPPGSVGGSQTQIYNQNIEPSFNTSMGMSFAIASSTTAMTWNIVNGDILAQIVVAIPPANAPSIWYPAVSTRNINDVVRVKNLNSQYVTNGVSPDTNVAYGYHGAIFWKNSFLHTVGRMTTAPGVHAAKSTTGILTTLQSANKNSTTAIKTTLEAPKKSTTALKTLLQTAGVKSTTALFTTLEEHKTYSTVAIFTTLSEPKLKTLGALTTLETKRNLGKAIFFTGGGYVDVPNATALHPTDVITVAITGYSANWAGITTKTNLAGYDNTSGFRFVTNDTTSDGLLRFKIHIGGSYFSSSVTLSSLSAGKHRFIGTFDGQFVKLYVDNVLIQSTNFGSVTTIDQGTNDLAIGDNMLSGSTPEGNPWNNGIDEFLLIHAAWTTTDIANDWGNVSGNPINKRSVIPNLVAGMHFDDNTANDFSGNSHNGTVVGSATYNLGWHVLNPPIAILTTLQSAIKKSTLAFKTTLQSALKKSTVAIYTNFQATTAGHKTLALLTNIKYRGNSTVAGLTTLESVAIANVPRGVALSGLEDGQTIIPGTLQTDYFTSTSPTTNYFSNQQKGLEFIRLPIYWERLQPSLGDQLDPTYKSQIDTFLSTAAASGLSVILDVHNFGRRNIVNTGGFSLLTSGSSDPMFFGNYSLTSGTMTFNQYNRIYIGSMDNPISPARGYNVQSQVEITSDNGQPWAAMYFEFFRKSDNNRYFLAISYGAGTGYIQLFKVVNGTQTQIGSTVNLTVAYNTFYTVNIDVGQAVANQISVSWNGSTVISGAAMDPALTGGQVAFWGNAANGGIQNFTLNVNGDTTSGRANSGLYRIGDPQIPITAFADLWTKLATAYSSNPTVYGYDLMNEPHDMPVPTTPSNYNTVATVTLMQQAAINAIRVIDKHKWIFFELDSYAGGENFVSNYGSSPSIWWSDPSNKTVIEFHYYFDTNYSGSYAQPFSGSNFTRIPTDLNTMISWAASNNVRLYAGEYGVPTNQRAWDQCMIYFLNLLNTNNIWGTAWLAGDIYATNGNNLSLQPTSFSPLVEQPQMQMIGRATYIGQMLDMITVALTTRLEKPVKKTVGILTTLEATGNSIFVQQPALIVTPSAGTLENSATWLANGVGGSQGFVELTTATNGLDGEYDFSTKLPPVFTANWSFWTGGGSGADASYFYWGCTTPPTGGEDAGVGGYIVAFDEYSGDSAPVQLQFNGTRLANTTGTATFADSNWHAAKVTVSGNTITIFLDGVQVLQYVDSTRVLGGIHFGWGGRTGGLNNYHLVRQFVINGPNKTVGIKTTLEATVPTNPQLDQQNLSNNISTPFGTFTGTRYLGFGFTPNTTGYLREIAISRTKGTQGLQFYFDTAGSNSQPTHGVNSALYSFQVANSAITGGYQTFILPTPLYVVAGQQYCWYAAPWDTVNNVYANDSQGEAILTSPYSGGQEIVNTNGVWSSNSNMTPVYSLYIQPATNVALFANLVQIFGKRTVALFTNLIYQKQSTLGLFTTLEETNVKKTLALKTTLQTVPKNSTLALKTTLEVIPRYSTVALLTTLEAKKPTVPIVKENMNSSPSTGTLIGNAAWNNAGYLLLTAAQDNQFGSIQYNQQLPTNYFETTFDFWTGGGSGAHAVYFYFGWAVTPQSEDGQGANNGYIFAYDEYFNDQQPYQISWGTTRLANTTGSAPFGDSNWHKARITIQGTLFTMYLDRNQVLQFNDSARVLPGNLFGWAARTALLNNQHRVRNVILNITPLTNVGVLTTLESKPVSTVALKTLLESSKQYSTVALATTLQSQVITAAAIALHTTLETASGKFKSTTALLTTLSEPKQKTLAINTRLEKTVFSTLALKTTLQTAGNKSTVALITALEKVAVKKTLALFTTLETYQTRRTKYGLLFDGSQNYLSLGTMGNFGSSLASGFYVSFQINTTYSGNNGLLFYFNHSSYSLFARLDTGGAHTYFQLNDNSGNQLSAYITTAFNNGSNHTLIITANPTAKTITFTLDGTPITPTYTSQATLSSWVNFVNPLVVAADNPGGTPGGFLSGTISNFQIGTSATNLYGSYPFLGAFGATTPDISGKGNTGTLEGNPLPIWVNALTATLENIAILTTLESNKKYSTVALYTNLGKGVGQTLALKTTLESNKKYSTVALKTLLQTTPQFSTVALKTTLEEKPRSTTALLTTLEEHAVYKTVALKTTLELVGVKKTLALKTTLEKYKLSSTVALKTTLQTTVQKTTVALFTTISKLKVSTVAILTFFIGSKASTVPMATRLEKITHKTVALGTLLEPPKVFKSVAMLTTLSEPRHKTLAIQTLLETHKNPKTVAMLATLVHFIGWDNPFFGHIGWFGSAELNVPTPPTGKVNDGSNW